MRRVSAQAVSAMRCRPLAAVLSAAVRVSDKESELKSSSDVSLLQEARNGKVAANDRQARLLTNFKPPPSV